MLYVLVTVCFLVPANVYSWWGGPGSGGRNETFTVSLTKAQVSAIQKAHGKNVTINLPAKQIPGIKNVQRKGKTLPGTKVVLNTTHLNTDNKVTLKVTRIPTGILEVTPLHALKK